MERLDLVSRRIDRAGQRTRVVGLTARGHELLALTRRTRRQLEVELARSVGDLDDVKRTLVALLDSTGAAAAVRRRAVLPPLD